VTVSADSVAGLDYAALAEVLSDIRPEFHVQSGVEVFKLAGVPLKINVAGATVSFPQSYFAQSGSNFPVDIKMATAQPPGMIRTCTLTIRCGAGATYTTTIETETFDNTYRGVVEDPDDEKTYRFYFAENEFDEVHGAVAGYLMDALLDIDMMYVILDEDDNPQIRHHIVKNAAIGFGDPTIPVVEAGVNHTVSLSDTNSGFYVKKGALDIAQGAKSWRYPALWDGFDQPDFWDGPRRWTWKNPWNCEYSRSRRNTTFSSYVVPGEPLVDLNLKVSERWPGRYEHRLPGTIWGARYMAYYGRNTDGRDEVVVGTTGTDKDVLIKFCPDGLVRLGRTELEEYLRTASNWGGLAVSANAFTVVGGLVALVANVTTGGVIAVVSGTVAIAASMFEEGNLDLAEETKASLHIEGAHVKMSATGDVPFRGPNIYSLVGKASGDGIQEKNAEGAKFEFNQCKLHANAAYQTALVFSAHARVVVPDGILGPPPEHWVPLSRREAFARLVWDPDGDEEKSTRGKIVFVYD
jgi:hypothetical protein